jgi:hypothetical protein
MWMNMDGSGNLNSHGWQMMTNYETIMHHEELKMPKVQYLVFFSTFGFCLLFCKLVYLMFIFQWSGLGELVSVMEHIPCYCVFMRNVNHNSWLWLV